MKSTFWGAVSGAVSFGLGELFSAGSVVKALGDAKFLIQAAAHGVSQGVLSVMQGGDFLSGAAGGFLGSLGAEFWSGAMKDMGLIKFANSTIGTVAFGALSGGIGAELSGGNFWQGAVTGGIVAGLNHAMHKQIAKFQIKKDLRAEFQEADMDPDSKASFEDHAELTEKLPTLKNIKDKITEKAQLNFKEDNSSKGPKAYVSRNSPNDIQINSLALKTKLDYAFTLGHEMIHVFDIVYNTKIMINILGSGYSNVKDYYMEVRAYQWEINNGNNIDINKYLNALGVQPYVKEHLNKNLDRLIKNVINP